ncbi:SIS domain-containing protein [Mucilaginibacter sp. UR6-1]|uniref:SIS domain-containing protein n=1 Tax=Mucilaginibacter sp. UR6-1 TaxID=1435643 RepID=UPI001E5ECF6B|nr:SIS domain-containing protein [Mucilaginibacter sp. UR6-1]MCC8409611.1 SIS domain-containing protein [Mucilaginibacter sp. UR6-1]
MDRKNTVTEHLVSYKQKIVDLLELIDPAELEQVITVFIDTFKNGKTVYVAGNGGSAATASHMQADFRFFVRYFSKFRPRILALTDNAPLMTAVGNDTDFNDIFVEQMRGVFGEGDTLVVISASGNSENLVRAVDFANEQGGNSISFIGFKGGKLKENSKYKIYTPNQDKDYGPIEDIHMIINHIIVNYLAKDEEFLSL